MSKRYECRFQRAVPVILAAIVAAAHVLDLKAEIPTIRIATYNTSLNRDHDGELIRDLEGGKNKQAQQIAEVIQRIRPDIVLLNEFDYDEANKAAEAFRKEYVAIAQNGCEPIKFNYLYAAPVNTGLPSGRDLNHDGRIAGPDDAIGFGRHAGQYGMLVLSKYPIDKDNIRTFQKLLWRDMPGALLPTDPATKKPWYDDADLANLRLSSKSHWDIPITVPAKGERKQFVLHLLSSHPTPPVFDGREDRNGRRNHDEVRLLADYITSKSFDYLVDDSGKRGCLAADAMFAIVGDLNCDPVDGEGMRGTMDQLFTNPRVNASFTPTSKGGPEVVKQHPDQFTKNHGDPSHVTADFTPEKHGCLRIDYVLPSREFEITKGGIFWPRSGEPGADAIAATDHRMVWLDIRPATQ